jgi:hypothetical protein
MEGRRAFVIGGALGLAGCFDEPYYEQNATQKKFLEDLKSIAKPALASNNPLQIEDAARKTVTRADQVGAFNDWQGILKTIEGNAQNMAVTLEIGPQVSLYAFNDWALALAGSLAGLFSTRSREAPPPGLSDPAIAALKTFRLGERVALAGRMGAIAGSGLFDLSRLFGKSDTDNRQFLQAPQFVARIEALTSEKERASKKT